MAKLRGTLHSGLEMAATKVAAPFSETRPNPTGEEDRLMSDKTYPQRHSKRISDLLGVFH